MDILVVQKIFLGALNDPSNKKKPYFRMGYLNYILFKIPKLILIVLVSYVDISVGVPPPPLVRVEP